MGMSRNIKAGKAPRVHEAPEAGVPTAVVDREGGADVETEERVSLAAAQSCPSPLRPMKMSVLPTSTTRTEAETVRALCKTGTASRGSEPERLGSSQVSGASTVAAGVVEADAADAARRERVQCPPWSPSSLPTTRTKTLASPTFTILRRPRMEIVTATCRPGTKLRGREARRLKGRQMPETRTAVEEEAVEADAAGNEKAAAVA